MAQTLVEKWSALFPNGNPDAHRTATSQTSDSVENPLSEVGGLDNEYTSGSTLPTGRQSQCISVLWNLHCGVKSDSDADIDHLSTKFGVKEGSPLENGTLKMKRAMAKNVTVRATTDAVAAVAPSAANEWQSAAAQAAVLHATVKSNYRLGSVNPDGGFSNYTGRPMTNGGDDIATLTLQQWRDGMG